MENLPLLGAFSFEIKGNMIVQDAPKNSYRGFMVSISVIFYAGKM